MRNKTNIINKRFRNKNDLGNYEFIIVEYNNSDDVWVEFQDEYKAKVHTTHQHCNVTDIDGIKLKNNLKLCIIFYCLFII